ncbi:MAG: DoxX family protein [Propionibacterium sp.]|nr:MAG: DoxX family protein [Propionibacterium sp.]
MSTSAKHSWRDWVGLIVRVALAGVWLAAAMPKLANIPWFIHGINAYQLLPPSVAEILGYVLPVLELAAGILLLLGLLTRPAAIVSALMLAAFIFGISWAWAQGLSIDCGCFGSGGEIAPEATRYPEEIARDVGLLLLAGWLIVRPASALSLDRRLFSIDAPADES